MDFQAFRAPAALSEIVTHLTPRYYSAWPWQYRRGNRSSNSLAGSSAWLNSLILRVRSWGFGTLQLWKVCRVETEVSSEKSVSRSDGVGANQKVGEDALPWPAGPAVLYPAQPGLVGDGCIQGGCGHVHFLQSPVQCRSFAKERDKLCVQMSQMMMRPAL